MILHKEASTHTKTLKYFDKISKELPLRYPNLDFSETEFKNSREPFIVKCAIHGYFKVLATTLMKNCTTLGCRRCSMTLSAKKFKNTTESFIEKAKLVHKDNLTYEHTIFTRSDKPIIVTCKKHGIWKAPKAERVLSAIYGCPKCSKEYWSKKAIKPWEEVYKAFIEKHGYTYKYIESSYVDANTEMRMICKIHGEFLKSPSRHIEKDRAAGCQLCAKSGFIKEKPGMLYYLKYEKEDVVLYKIGITNKDVKYRYLKEDRKYLTEIFKCTFQHGKDVYDLEQKILKEFNSYRCEDKDLLVSGGGTELFTTDITKINKNIFKGLKNECN